MALKRESLRAIIFDYGSTLIQFNAPQIDACDRALSATLKRFFGDVDYDALKRVRDEDRRRPYVNGFRENRMPGMCANMVRQLYGRDPRQEELDELLKVRHASFVNAVRAPSYLNRLLGELGRRYRLALLSNYPDAPALRESLDRIGLTERFQAVVVSADVGRVKPHEAPFKKVLATLGVSPAQALCVGDNWLGDIQGAKRLGMAAVWTLQFDSPEKFDRKPDDLEPDLIIHHLTELREHL